MTNKKVKKTDNLLSYATDKYLELSNKIRTRCALEGCRYGYEGFDNEPADNCIYCGEPRKYFDVDCKNIVSIQKSLKKLKPRLIWQIT